MIENVFENKIINIVETKGVAAYPWLDVINKIIVNLTSNVNVTIIPPINSIGALIPIRCIIPTIW